MNLSSWLFSRPFCLKSFLNPSILNNGRINPNLRASHSKFFTARRTLSTCVASNAIIAGAWRAPSTPSSLLQFVSNGFRSETHRYGRQRLASQYGRVRPPMPEGRPQGGSSWRRFREQFDRVPQNVVLWSVLGLNGIIFLAWNIAETHWVCVCACFFFRRKVALRMVHVFTHYFACAIARE